MFRKMNVLPMILDFWIPLYQIKERKLASIWLYREFQTILPILPKALLHVQKSMLSSSCPQLSDYHRYFFYRPTSSGFTKALKRKY